MIEDHSSTPWSHRESLIRRILRKLGLFWTSALLTVIAILFSLILTNLVDLLVSGETAGTIGNLIAILVPLILAPLFGILNLRLLFHLDKTEEHLQLLTIQDELTGAANRRHFIVQAQGEVERSKRYGSILSIAFMDIDDFKIVNDTYGHLAGDQVLIHLAHIGMKNVRTVDTFARYAGDEFVILMPETPREKASDCVERIRSLVASQPVNHNSSSIHFTISAGVLTIDSPLNDLEDLLIRVDRALYSAKKLGKNQVIAT